MQEHNFSRLLNELDDPEQILPDAALQNMQQQQAGSSFSAAPPEAHSNSASSSATQALDLSAGGNAGNASTDTPKQCHLPASASSNAAAVLCNH